MPFTPNFHNLKDEIPSIMFHYSPAKNRTSILKEGLKVHPPKKYWDIQEAGVYLFADPLRAWHWQHVSYKNLKQKQLLYGDLWMVYTKNLNLQSDVYIPNAVYSSKNISNQHLLLMPGQMTQKLNQVIFSQENIKYKFSLLSSEEQTQLLKYLANFLKI